MPQNRRRQPSGHTGPTGHQGHHGPGGPAGRDARGPGRTRRQQRVRPEPHAGGTTRATAVVRPGAPATSSTSSAAGRTTTRKGRAGSTRGKAGGPRPRLTGRAAVLVLVLAVLAVSYASSLRAYLDQRAHLDDLQATIATREGEIDALEDERTRWQDPSFVRNQARERLGYVRPGETAYVAMRDGEPVEGEASLDQPGASTSTQPPAWYDDMWESARVAGDPPTTSTPPADRIDGRTAEE